MKPIIKYILLTALRDRLYAGLFLTLIASFALAIFLGQTALVEQQQMTIAYIAGSSRAILTVGMILFVCLSINRAFENKEVEFILAKAISRQQFIISYLSAFFLIAFLIFLPLIAVISILAAVNKLGLLIWSLSLLSEILIVISFALLASLILKNSFLAIASSFGFYIISRLMGVFVMAIELPQEFTFNKGNILASILKLFSVFFPRLDLYGQSNWLIYGIDNFFNIKVIFLQSAIYLPLMIFMAFHDFKKKQF
jgi:ABC-type transport system involved in multi-copper enzyme maturation permease subunit